MTLSKAKKMRRKRIRHVIDRAFERFGAVISREDVEDAERSILSGGVIDVSYEEDLRAAYLLDVKGVRAVWVYEKACKGIVTVVSISMYGEASRKQRKK